MFRLFKRKEKPKEIVTHNIDYNLMYINKTMSQIEVVKYNPAISEEDKKIIIEQLELHLKEQIKRLKDRLQS
jgi:hypothetical protein